jgi:3-hydroxyacyl-CoA dehydrogenase
MTDMMHASARSAPVAAAGVPRISTVAVLGAGTMGAQIAAHFANAGVPALLLDLDAKTARDGLDRARRLKPDPLFGPDALALIRTGGFDADLERAKDADWILEAVVERLDVKRELLARVDAVRRPGSIVSSNTSGIPIAALAEGRSDDFRRHWLGTHFFNPPRYLRLLEIIPTPETDPAVIDTVSAFADHRLGKGVVVAKDTPNFIANHVALYGVIRMIDVLSDGGYSVEEIDAITGPALGRPKSATFRTMDIAGLDVLALVVRNLYDRLPEGAREAFAVPPLLARLIDKGWIGEKAGQGFYKRVKNAAGESEIHALDPATMEYRPAQPVKLGALEASKSIDDIRERVRTLFGGPDKVGSFLRRTLAPTLIYTARVSPEIAHSIDDVDRVLQWGFGWELGPFELIDAIGVDAVVDAWRQSAGADGEVPAILAEAIASGRNRIRAGAVPPAGPDLQILRTAKERERVVKRNAGASLVDLGEGVLAIEFHSKMNAIGGDTIQMINAGVAEAERNFQALVVGNDAPNFSAGANVMLLLLEAQEGNWDEIDLMVRGFQGATSALRFAKVPVVVAPAGLALGGGCEVALHGDRVQAAAETYIGLVEVGVGLIPAGGGTKEMLARAVEALAPQADLLPASQRVFETIGFAKVATSAADARGIGYLRGVDGVSMNRERLLWDARQKALERVRDGYQAPQPRSAIRVGGEGVRAALTLGVHLAWRAGRISDHDALIGRKLAGILSGGAVPHATTVSEQHLLDLEREAFVSLCGERKTLERIAHTLKTGKPLRN